MINIELTDREATVAYMLLNHAVSSRSFAKHPSNQAALYSLLAKVRDARQGVEQWIDDSPEDKDDDS